MIRSSSFNGLSEVPETWSSFVSNSVSLWNLYQTATTFNCRPSDLVDVRGPFDALCLDNAVSEFGSALDGELKGVEGKTKKVIEGKVDRIMRKWLDMPPKFRDPVASGKVQLPTEHEDS
jgi:hypothetical protein